MGCLFSSGSKYDEYDWGELPEEAKAAAETLGYTKKLWNGDKEPQIMKDSDWGDLTEEHQAAAKVLGYNEKNWEEE
eukprot:CAMPEP_0194145752 /NCGR_PEP_ID=MMETSP0152-20130528/18812_1 /TAXON_ID=1049557 /ORGANISM="Thalassiothrix antarctica, Strain L6-D1" /LENGTH=75 /DNA_ID=CAMNT_0038846087 /DNA_START=76 /DNA_END=303 /DNA_ORIENTATION=-